MKKAAFKLVICRETLRLLTGMELGFIGGGAGSGNAGTGCPNVRLVDTGDMNRTCVAQAARLDTEDANRTCVAR